MEKITWEVQLLSLPPALKYCKKCGKKTTYTCSEQFRINAQKKSLDIWLIYKCSHCNDTWNAAVYSRISPKSLNMEILDGFHRNDRMLVERYATDAGFLQRNGAEVGLPEYLVVGDSFSPEEGVELTIKCSCFMPVKVSSLIRDKLHISRKEYERMVMEGRIRSIPNQDLQRCRLKNGINLIFQEVFF